MIVQGPGAPGGLEIRRPPVKDRAGPGGSPSVVLAFSKFAGRRTELETDDNIKRVRRFCISLSTTEAVAQAFNELSRSAAEMGEPEVRITDGGPDRNNAHWYKFEVVESANEAGKFANFTEHHYFVERFHPSGAGAPHLCDVVPSCGSRTLRNHGGDGLLTAPVVRRFRRQEVRFLVISLSAQSSPSSLPPRRTSRISRHRLLGGWMRHSQWP